ncbi:MAG: PspA-associated protein PspAA [Halobacteriota archaeon]
MIVRILGDNQYVLDSKYLDELNELDNCMVQHLDDNQVAEFNRCLHELIRIIKEKGTPLDPTEIRPSDLIVPSPDLTREEARELFSGEGIIPG